MYIFEWTQKVKKENLKKSFENERRIERRSFVTERERKTAKKLSASGAQNSCLSAEREHFFLAH